MQTLKKFKQFVDEINLENGRNYKISVLEKYRDNEDIKYYLNYIFNPYIVTGINEKKLNKLKTVELVELPFARSIKNLLTYISEHNTGKDEVINYINVYKTIENIQSDICELLNKIICKNVILGVEVKTINKVFPKLIPTFNVQLANRYFDNEKVIEGKEFAITTKIDGMRCIMLKENGTVTFWSRQGKQIEGLVDLIKESKSFSDNICLDGELIAKETSKEDTYKNTMKTATTKDVEKHNLKMMVFDYMPINDFTTQTGSLIYKDRREQLDLLFKNNYEFFTLLPVLYQGSDTTQIEKILKEQVANGEEGIMLNMCDADYEFGRSNVLLKCKLFKDTEVKIVDFENGTNKNSGTLGALLCEYKNNIVRVGSGFSDELRNEIWNNREKYIGKIVTVKYFEETTSEATSLPSLRFPVFLRFREDI